MGILARALLSGALGAVAVSAVAAVASRRSTGSYASAMNATSHVLWGREAAMRNAVTWKYTATGMLTNLAASIFWALLYEALRSRGRQNLPGTLGRAALVSGAAYVVDYHVVPKRFTPGFELRLPGRALTAIYAALALGLSCRELFSRRRRDRPRPA
jgi:hypothetical protein